GEVVEAEAELGLLDPVFEVGLGAVPALDLVRAAFFVVGDDRPVMPLASFERELLAGLDWVAADDEAARDRPAGRLPGEARHLASFAVAGRPPVALGDLADPCPDRGEQRRADRVGDPHA